MFLMIILYINFYKLCKMFYLFSDWVFFIIIIYDFFISFCLLFYKLKIFVKKLNILIISNIRYVCNFFLDIIVVLLCC